MCTPPSDTNSCNTPPAYEVSAPVHKPVKMKDISQRFRSTRLKTLSEELTFQLNCASSGRASMAISDEIGGDSSCASGIIGDLMRGGGHTLKIVLGSDGILP